MRIIRIEKKLGKKAVIQNLNVVLATITVGAHLYDSQGSKLFSTFSDASDGSNYAKCLISFFVNKPNLGPLCPHAVKLVS